MRQACRPQLAVSIPIESTYPPDLFRLPTRRGLMIASIDAVPLALANAVVTDQRHFLQLTRFLMHTSSVNAKISQLIRVIDATTNNTSQILVNRRVFDAHELHRVEGVLNCALVQCRSWPQVSRP